MPSPLVNATLQAAALSALSNLLAQGIKAYQKGVRLSHGWRQYSIANRILGSLTESRCARPIRVLHSPYLPTELPLAAILGRIIPGLFYRGGWLAITP